MLTIDRTAARTLAAMFWDAGGWKPKPERPSDEAYEQAQHAGYVFEPVVMDHDTLVSETRRLARATSLRAASDSFVASLSSRWLFLRPAIAAFVIARQLPEHGFEELDEGRCAICDLSNRRQEIDLDVLNFERHKWGGVRFRDLRFVWFCLDRLQAEGTATPDAADVELLQSILGTVRSLPPGVSLNQAESQLRELKSNKDERTALLEVLTTIGVLDGWGRDLGVNDQAVRELFPQLDPAH